MVSAERDFRLQAVSLDRSCLKGANLLPVSPLGQGVSAGDEKDERAAGAGGGSLAARVQ